MTTPQLYEWTRAEKMQLARFVVRTIPAEINLPTYINRADLIKEEGNLGLVRQLYGRLARLQINYDLEPANSQPNVQKIRSIQAILEERRGTCLDLALLFCSVCIANDLYPLLIVANEHAYAAFQTEDRLQDAARKQRPRFGSFSNGILSDLGELQSLLNDGYTFVECTGFARSQAQLSNQNFAEGRGRDGRGLMEFQRAVDAGSEQVQHNAHSFEYALDIYVLQEEYNQRPIDDQKAQATASGDMIYAQGSEGFINRPTGPVTQVFGPQTNVSGDTITTGNISGSGIAIGRGAQSTTRTVHTGGGDYAEGNIDKSKRTTIQGDQFNMSGNFSGAILNIRSSLSNVSQSIGGASVGDQATRDELQRLINQLNSELQRTPQQSVSDAEAVTETAKQLVAHAIRERPNRSLLQITGEGLKQAAQNLKQALPEVISTVSSIVAIALKLVG